MASTSINPPQVVDLKWRQGVDPASGGRPPIEPNRHEIADGMEITWDVPVQVRDGTILYVDVFRPENFQAPLPIILTISPYGKHGPKTFALFPGSGVPEGSVSPYCVWEGPDPLYWTKRGYAVVNADSRGSWGSGGDLEIFSRQESQDGYDVVEWAGTRDWSNGKVATMGVSYLAIVQWGIAELNPPHLACFIPWEGFTDLYRDYCYHGGIPETKFLHFTAWSCRAGFNKVEDWIQNIRDHPLCDAYHKSKCSQDLSKIRVPAYVVIDWGDHGMHTRGCLNGFVGIASTDKFLEVHGQKKWRYFFQDSSLKRQEAFLAKYLKGESTDVDSWPRVRLEIRDRAWKGSWRDEHEWPLARTQYTPKYLDAATGTLSDTPVRTASVAAYESTVVDDSARFTYTFDKETELTGGMRLRLWVATDAADDMDLFVQLDKIDVQGERAPFVAFSMVDDGPLALGWLRVSHRELDLRKSTVDRPWHKHERELLLEPMEVVPVDVEILPTSTVFPKGEKLRLNVQGNDSFRHSTPNVVQFHEDLRNKGKHFIYTGGLHESYLVFPEINS
ncbi:Cocaine esterase [Lasiodiplodia theobromae]|uniref:Cocaine esterase n=1 Tax=Lasiodiplodia theobromae TaxID=45133 RepID=A0A5N5D7L3_9PEZI|nr:Cocaine esterase [Lasiodiplodia theobromae]